MTQRESSGDHRETQDPVTVFRQAATLHSQGKLSEAEELYRALLINHPDHFEALHYLGVLCRLQGKFREAASLIGKALSQKPEWAEAHFSLGVVYLLMVRYSDALVHYGKALAIRPNFPEAYNMRGIALQALHREEEAIAQFRQAIALRPDYAESYGNIGSSLQELGRIDEARQAFEKAIELAPKRPRFYRQLGECRRIAAESPWLAAMEEMGRDLAKLSEDDRIELHFALGKAYDDLGDPERSFHHLHEGNAIRRRQITYDEPATLKIFDDIRATYTPALMREKSGSGHPSSLPIFILGMPRSGSTLVEQILASHPKVYGAGERADFHEAVATIEGRNPPTIPAVVPTLTGDQLQRLGALYVSRMSADAPQAERITDKMPGNFVHAGLIHLALPNARIIHTRRDPVDTCFSCFARLFTQSKWYTYDLGELGRYYRGYQQLMEHWRRILPEGAMLEVQYEDVVADLEGQARRIVAFCGLEWDDACLAFHRTQRAIRTASAPQVRQPIYHSSVGRWRAYAHLLWPLLAALGFG